jgi:predicted TIM-barrel fold metal-dependent hydrolase
VDAHLHLFSPRLAALLRAELGDTYLTVSIESITATTLLERLDEAGVERAFLLSTAYINAADIDRSRDSKRRRDEYRHVQEDNNFIASEASQSARRLIPFMSVNPKRDYAVEELSRCVGQLGMRGLKVHFANSDVRLRDPHHVEAVRELFSHAEAMDAPVVAHIFNEQVERFGSEDIRVLISEIIEPLPKLRISIAHLGGGGGFGPQVQEAFRALIDAVAPRQDLAQRVWVDCAAVMHTDAPPPIGPTTRTEGDQLRELLGAWGAYRTLWGSDTEVGALEQTRGLWPLGNRAWEIMAGSDGSEFIGF